MACRNVVAPQSDCCAGPCRTGHHIASAFASATARSRGSGTGSQNLSQRDRFHLFSLFLLTLSNFVSIYAVGNGEKLTYEGNEKSGSRKSGACGRPSAFIQFRRDRPSRKGRRVQSIRGRERGRGGFAVGHQCPKGQSRQRWRGRGTCVRPPEDEEEDLGDAKPWESRFVRLRQALLGQKVWRKYFRPANGH